MKLAIIGTAGRGDDAAKLTKGHFDAMVLCAANLLFRNQCNAIVSGGAAWADHVAIRLCQEGDSRGWEIISLELRLPGTGVDVSTAIRYHSRFSAVIGRNTWKEVQEVYKLGVPFCRVIQRGSFKDRNMSVANAATHFLAMTFGNGPCVKDGGTKDTVRKMLAQGKTGWHLDLNTMILHPCTA